MGRKAYANNATDMRNEQIKDALIRALDTKFTRIALKKIVNDKSTALKPQLLFAHLIEKIQHVDIIRTRIDWYKIRTISTLSSSIINMSTEIDNHTGDFIQTREQNIAYGNNVVRHKHSNDPNVKRKPLFLKTCKNVHNQDTVYILAWFPKTDIHSSNEGKSKSPS